jgi:hypothetical protein
VKEEVSRFSLRAIDNGSAKQGCSSASAMCVLLTTVSFSAAASFGERRGHQSKELTG